MTRPQRAGRCCRGTLQRDDLGDQRSSSSANGACRARAPNDSRHRARPPADVPAWVPTRPANDTWWRLRDRRPDITGSSSRSTGIRSTQPNTRAEAAPSSGRPHRRRPSDGRHRHAPSGGGFLERRALEHLREIVGRELSELLHGPAADRRVQAPDLSELAGCHRPTEIRPSDPSPNANVSAGTCSSPSVSSSSVVNCHDGPYAAASLSCPSTSPSRVNRRDVGP